MTTSVVVKCSGSLSYSTQYVYFSTLKFRWHCSLYTIHNFQKFSSFVIHQAITLLSSNKYVLVILPVFAFRISCFMGIVKLQSKFDFLSNASTIFMFLVRFDWLHLFWADLGNKPCHCQPWEQRLQTSFNFAKLKNYSQAHCFRLALECQENKYDGVVPMPRATLVRSQAGPNFGMRFELREDVCWVQSIAIYPKDHHFWNAPAAPLKVSKKVWAHR